MFDYRKRDARLWSNDRLREIGAAVRDCQSMINVSGWRDGDKEGGHYRDYFPSVPLYHVSNHPGDAEKGVDAKTDRGIDLDLELLPELERSYDIVFNHTVLEHVPRPAFSFEQLAKLATKVLITVVPFKQGMHFSPGNFGDYYRFSPMAMRDCFARAGMQVVHESANEGIDTIYLLHVGVRDPAFIDRAVHLVQDIERFNFRLGVTRPRDIAAALYIRLFGAFLKR